MILAAVLVNALIGSYIDALLDRVEDPARSMLVCRLAATAITADGYLSVDDWMH